MPLDALPAIGRAALLLDLDGTLIDIAATPDAVRVAAGLPEVLARLGERLGGALAIVTGRPIAQVDGLLPGMGVVAGEHGGVVRVGGVERRAALPGVPEVWVAEAKRVAEEHPGVLVEQKERGFVFHYRAAPGVGPMLGEVARAMVAQDGRFQVISALMAWEIRPGGVDKGSAVEALMGAAPFAGRVPVFIGDDVTDEDGMRVARRMGGAGLRVAEAFGDAAGVRDWLARAAETGAWPQRPF